MGNAWALLAGAVLGLLLGFALARALRVGEMQAQFNRGLHAGRLLERERGNRGNLLFRRRYRNAEDVMAAAHGDVPHMPGEGGHG